MIHTRSFAFPMMWALALAILSGCATDLNNIPGNATIASSGNDHLSYTAPTHGRIWVYDVSNDRIDYSGPISKDVMIKVDPGTNSVTIDGRIVADKLDHGAQHRIYFVPRENSAS